MASTDAAVAATETEQNVAHHMPQCISDSAFSDDTIITLESADEVNLKVHYGAIKRSITISAMLDGDEDVLPISNIDSNILELVIRYCEHHALEPHATTTHLAENMDKPLSDWDSHFMNVSYEDHLAIGIAAHFLDIPDLEDVFIKSFIDKFLDKKTDAEICAANNIVCDYSADDSKAMDMVTFYEDYNVTVN